MTLGFSRFAGVPVRVRERALSYRAFLLFPKGPDSSAGRLGLRDSLRGLVLVRADTEWN